MAQRRKRVIYTATFEERLAEEAIKFKAAAEKRPPTFAACTAGRDGTTHQQSASISRTTAAQGTRKFSFRSEEVRPNPRVLN